MTTPVPKTPFLTRIVEVFLRGDVAVLLTLVSLAVGVAALVPDAARGGAADRRAAWPTCSSARRACRPRRSSRRSPRRLEKLLYQIDGVEYVYSMSRPGQASSPSASTSARTAKNSLVKLYNKIQSQHRPDPARRDRLGGQADRGGRRADRQRHALVRPDRAVRRLRAAAAWPRRCRTSCRRSRTRTASG